MSDTHGHLDSQVLPFFADCDEIWHAGDIGDPRVMEPLEAAKPVKAVWGNIDGPEIRQRYPEVWAFECAGVKVVMLHIGGKHIAQPAQGFDQHWLVRVVLYFAPQPHD